jgi:hypothetical protein
MLEGMQYVHYTLYCDFFKMVLLDTLQWIAFIVQNRPHEGNDAEGLRTIDDIRNGMLTNSNIHVVHDARKIVVLKVGIDTVHLFGFFVYCTRHPIQ